MAGGKLIEIGQGERPSIIEDAINEKTAAILALRGTNSMLPIEEVVKIGKRRDIPILLDAAGDTYPADRMKYYTGIGVDLVAQGAKYFGGPASAGILYGRRDLVEAASFHSFTSFERVNYPDYYTDHPTGCLPLGRAMKVDKHEVVGTFVALRRWFETDHRAEFEDWHKKAEHIARGLNAIRGVTARPSNIPWGERMGIATCVRVAFDEKTLRTTTVDIVRSLQSGTPSVWVRRDGDDMVISTETLLDGDEEVIIRRLKELLS